MILRLVSYPIDSNKSFTFSVETLPFAPGEYGHPPRPPTEESKVLIPYSKEIFTLFNAF